MEPLNVSALLAFLAPFTPILKSAGNALWNKVKDKVAEGLTETSWEYAKKCWQLLRGKASGDTLDALEEDPKDTKALGDWAASIERAQANDPEFARQLQSILIEGNNNTIIHIVGDQNQVVEHLKVQASDKGQAAGGNIYNVSVAPTPLEKDPLPAPQVQAAAADFVGREQEQSQLLAALRGGGLATICAIGGLGGVGKSELARRVAHALRSEGLYPDGQIWVDMQGMNEPPLSPERAMQSVLAELDRTATVPEEPDALSRQYRQTLQGKHLLLVLDDARNYAQIGPLLPPDGCGLLVTSRTTIQLAGRECLSLDTLPSEPARELLASLTTDREFSAADLDALADRCGYLPLALRAAGTFLARYRSWSLADYLKDLSDERTRLARLKVEVQNIDVKATLGLSAKQLEQADPELYTHWRMLAVFPAPFDGPAAQAVWAADDGAARDGLAKLVADYSLLLFDEGSQRHRLHDLMRDVALSLSGPDDSVLAAARLRHAEHYVTVLALADNLYLKGGDNIQRGLALFDQERRHIEAGQAWAAAHASQTDAATRLTDAYPDAGVYVLALRLARWDHVAWLEAAVIAARVVGDRRTERLHLGSLGSRYGELGEQRKAIKLYERALAINQDIGNLRVAGALYGNLGNCHALLDEPRKAIEYYEKAMDIERKLGDRRGEGSNLGNLGNAYAGLGEWRKAKSLYEMALAIRRETGDRRGEGIDLGNLGNVSLATRQPRMAINLYEQALIVRREIGDRGGEAQDLGNIGNCHLALGDPQGASEIYERALAINREIGDRRNEGLWLFNMAEVLINVGQRERALSVARESLRIREEIEDPKADKVRAWLAEHEQEPP